MTSFYLISIEGTVFDGIETIEKKMAVRMTS